MATLAARVATAAALAGCGELSGLDPDQLTPLASIHVRVTGDLDAVRMPSPQPPKLRATLLWGQPWLPDASCLPPIEHPQHAKVVEKACGDPLGFRRAGFERPEGPEFALDGTTTLDLYSVPDTLFGDMFSQIVYGSVVIYDDVNDDRRLDPFVDAIYGASLSSMSKPDTRVAFRHGGFDDRLAYYPRRGCEPPVEGYSLVSAGGFTLEQAIEAQARGELPLQDPALCHRDAIDREITVELVPAEELAQINCLSFGFRIGPPPPFEIASDPEHPIACTSIPDHGTGRGRGRYQLLVTQTINRSCTFLDHFMLRGCFDDPLCEVPEWDVPPPSWWPCPAEGAP